MDHNENHPPAGADVPAPSATRILDYLLGDGRNVAGDRQLADEVQRTVPDIGLVVRLNRMFMLMRSSSSTVHPRTYEEVSRLFTGFELLAPGVVDAGHWYAERPLNPTEQLAATRYRVGVARKPEPPSRSP
jgi:hypothetical protein